MDRAEEIADLLRRLRKNWCPCGSGGGLACDEDCPGDTSNPALADALIFLLEIERANVDEVNRGG